MDKYYYHCSSFAANVLLLFFVLIFAATCESMLPVKGKATETTSSSSSSGIPSKDKKLLSECFADILVLQFGEKTKFRGENNKQFVLNPLLVERAKLQEFLLREEDQTAALWDCINAARPFPDNDGINRKTGVEKLTDLMDIFRMEITKTDVIAPSQSVQKNLHNPQCLLDLGVIEGKILLALNREKGWEHYMRNDEEVEWFQELRAMERIVISKDGADHMRKCLRKEENPFFDVRLAEGEEPHEQHHLLLDGIDREKLVKIISKQVSFSERLLKKIVPFRIDDQNNFIISSAFRRNRGHPCFRLKNSLLSANKRVFLVEDDHFPPPGSIAGVNDEAESKKTFVKCLKGASTFANFLHSPKQLDILEHELHRPPTVMFQQIAVTQQMQQKLSNAQCWLDLGVLEGKIKMKFRTLYGIGEPVPWLEELMLQPKIVVSSNGATHLRECLREGAPYQAKLEEQTGTADSENHHWNLQLLDNTERSDLLEVIKQVPFSDWLWTNGKFRSKLTKSDVDTDEATTSSHQIIFSSYVPSDNKKFTRVCFADFLVQQYGQQTLMDENGNKKQFVLYTSRVWCQGVEKFMQENEEETAKLWNCVYTAHSHRERVNGNASKMVVDLMEILDMEIAKSDMIAPSKYLQQKLHNAQCLLDLGVIEGKILIGKLPDAGLRYFKHDEKAQWYQELRDSAKHQQIVLGKEGADFLTKCLQHNGNSSAAAFAVSISEGPGPAEQHLVLDGIDREELVKFISKLVPFSDWMIRKIGINQEQRQCFADLFVSPYFIVKSQMRGREFVVKANEISFANSITDLMKVNIRSAMPFVECLKRARPFANFFRDPKQVDKLVERYYDQEFLKQPPVTLSRNMQQKMHNVQCWLDLGALEGKLQIQNVKPIGNNLSGNEYINDEVPWQRELLKLANHQQPIVVSPEGAAHLQQCLHKGGPFEANLEKKPGTAENKWHLQLVDVNERDELLRSIKQTPFSEWLLKELFYEQNCVADFLVRHLHAKTKLKRFDMDLNPPKARRRIEWSDYVQQKQRPKQVHAIENAEEFQELESCLFSKTALLKFDDHGKQYIDLTPFFLLMGNGIYTSMLMAQELKTQSDCLAQFLTFKFGVGKKCLIKKTSGPTGQPLSKDFRPDQPFHEYIYNIGDIERAFAFSAENCHLPESETGVYSEDSAEFDLLWECGVRMTTTTEEEEEDEEGKKITITTMNVRKLLEIHTLAQLYLPAKPLETMCRREIVDHERDSVVCLICKAAFEAGEIKMTLPCNGEHIYHPQCIRDWFKSNATCPYCSAPLVPYDDTADQVAPQPPV